MLDVDTFLTTLYVLVDDFCKVHLAAEKRPGRAASLSRSEVIVLALIAQGGCFSNERAFYRYARRRDRLREIQPRRTAFRTH